MFKKIFTLMMLSWVAAVAMAQSAKLVGKVTDAKNKPVVAASVVLVETKKGTQTNIDGEFVLQLTIGKKYEIEISALGFETKRLTDVEVKAGVNDLYILLDNKADKLKEVVVKSSSAKKETVNAVIAFQKNTNTVASVVSAESIKRSPDRNTADVLKRTPGASLQDGKFLVVRGMADRYNQAMMNGILLTSTEPDRKTFAYDLIPASVIENIVINKAFVPELPGEWGGGLVQINTKDIPNKNFLNVQAGLGYNAATTGKVFYTDPERSSLNNFALDNGVRNLPSLYTRKSAFDTLSHADKIAIGKALPNAWSPNKTTAPLNYSFQFNGGFAGKLLNKQVGGTFAVMYNNTHKYFDQLNRTQAINDGVFTNRNYDYIDDRYVQDINVGLMGGFTVKLNNLNKISIKSLLNTTAINSVVMRSGYNDNRVEFIKGTEMAFKQNTFVTTQINGEHKIATPVTFKWFGAFNILDAYNPDQRRLYYSKVLQSDPWKAVISNSLSQESGSRIFQNLSDYVYTAGGDVNYSFNIGAQKQALKVGYMMQVKDRLYDAQLFANYLPSLNENIKTLTEDKIFAASSFGDGSSSSSLFAFDAIKGSNFRYMANTILNAGFLQLDNEISNKLRIVWGARLEHYDQLIGSVKTWDPRHVYSKILDVLPGLNATYKVNPKTNIRLSVSQTIVRPELREMARVNLYDFELNASVQGNPALERTKLSNFDLRYELYPKAGETFSIAGFYKHFEKPIEQNFEQGAGGASSFNYQNTNDGYAYGIEFELRKKLDFTNVLKDFIFHANASLLESKTQGNGFNRALQGQSPYLVNLGLLYDNVDKGLSATLLYNVAGERIYLVGEVRGGAPDIYEAPRSLLDFQVTKKVLKNKGEIKLNVADILNQRQYFYQNLKEGGKVSFQPKYDAYRFAKTFGTTFTVTFNYNIF